MGGGFHGGFGKTKGFENNLIDELERKGVKIDRNNVIFITKDGAGQIVWLESGTPSAGLEHIIQRHSDDFMDKHGIKEDDIPLYLKDVFSNGMVVYTRIINKNGHLGFEKLYSCKGQYYLLSGIGTNGFIVSAYPIDTSVALKLKGRYGK